MTTIRPTTIGMPRKGAAQGSTGGTQAPEAVIAFDPEATTSMSSLFYNKHITGVLPRITGTQNVTNWASAFNSNPKLTAITGPLDTSAGTNFSSTFNECTALAEIPPLDTSAGTIFYSMFTACSSLTALPPLDTANGTNFGVMFSNCVKLEHITLTSTAKGTDMNMMFYFCRALQELPEGLDTSHNTDFQSMFTTTDSLDVIDVDTVAMTKMSQICQGSAARHITLRNLGTQPSITGTTFYRNFFHYPTRWGQGTEAARQSVVDTLLTYSFDRAAAGYDALAVAIPSETLAVLTDEEKAAITAKGFTLSAS